MSTTVPLTQVIAQALREPEFRSRLLSDPKQTLGEMNVSIPVEQSVIVLESNETQNFFVLPVMDKDEINQLQGSLASVRSHRSIRAQVLIKASQDADYKAQLIENPKAVLTAAGMTLPETMTLTVLENSLQQLYIILPTLRR